MSDLELSCVICVGKNKVKSLMALIKTHDVQYTPIYLHAYRPYDHDAELEIYGPADKMMAFHREAKQL